MNEVYLFLLAIVTSFGFGLGSVAARAIGRLVRFEMSLRECRRRTLLRFELDQQMMAKAKAGLAAELDAGLGVGPHVFDSRGGHA